MVNRKGRSFYTTRRRKLSTAPWRQWGSRGAWCQKHSSWLFTIVCPSSRLLVILSTFMFACRASCPLTEPVTIFLTLTFELEIPPADHPNKDLDGALCEIMQLVRDFKRRTLCICNAVSHKCVLAFITKVDKWMLWRDRDNVVRGTFPLKLDDPFIVEWRFVPLPLASLKCVFYLLILFFVIVFETVPTR